MDRYLRDIFRFHSSPTKGWPDIAYNFLIDRFGGIWEGRLGSIDAPIKGSATGGSQGFAMLCCWLGNHHEEPPTEAAQQSMVSLLAWLAHTYNVDTTPGTTTEFISRGSQRHPEGKSVVAATISGHRDMSATVCPGDFAYPLVVNEFQTAVTLLRNNAQAAAVATTTTTAPTTTTTSAPPRSTSTTVVPVKSAPAASTTSPPTPGVTAPATISPATAEDETATAMAVDGDPTGIDVDWPIVGAAAAGAAAIGTTIWKQRSESS